MEINFPNLGNITIPCDLLSPHAVNVLLDEFDEMACDPAMTNRQSEIQKIVDKLFEVRRHLEGK